MPEMTRHFTPEFIEALRRAFNRYICQDGPEGKPMTWRYLFVHCIAKTAFPVQVRLWRPVTLIPVLQKLLDRCLNYIILSDASPISSNSWGFVRGHQATEVVQSLTELTQKTNEWGLGLVVFRGGCL